MGGPRSIARLNMLSQTEPSRSELLPLGARSGPTRPVEGERTHQHQSPPLESCALKGKWPSFCTGVQPLGPRGPLEVESASGFEYPCNEPFACRYPRPNCTRLCACAELCRHCLHDHCH